MVNRYEELRAADRRDRARRQRRGRADRLGDRDQDGPPVERRRGSRGPRRSVGRSCSSPPALSGSRSGRPARIRGPTGRTSGSSTRRTTGATTSSSATSSGRTTPSGSTSTSGSAAPTGRSPSSTASATGCRSCSRSRRARRSPRASTRASTPRARRSSRGSSRAAASRTRSPAGTTTSVTSASSTRRARSTSTRSCGGASARISASPPSRSGSATRSRTSGEAQALTALAVSLVARVARAHDEGEPLALQPHRLLEENLWRAIRYGLSGELIDLERGDVLPARARIERLIEWVAPVAEELGAADLIRAARAQRRRAPDRPVRRGRRPRDDLSRPRAALARRRPRLTRAARPAGPARLRARPVRVGDSRRL